MNVNNNFISADTALFQKAKARWVKDIHRQIDNVGKNEDGADNEAASDQVSLSANARTSLAGGRISSRRRSSSRRRMLPHSFNGQVPPQKKSDVYLPTQLQQGKARSTGKFKSMPFDLPTVESNQNTNARHSRVAMPEYYNQETPRPHGGGLKNPILDTVADFAGFLGDIASFGLESMMGLFGI